MSHNIDYSKALTIIDSIENILTKSNYTIYELVNGKKVPKNIKLETRSFLENPNKINIHHYRCHIHMIADSDNTNTATGNNLEIAFTLSHRYRADKISNKHAHIYLGFAYDESIDKIIFDGYQKTNNGPIKIIKDTNADEISDFLIYENISRMFNEDFDLVETPVNEIKVYKEMLKSYNHKSTKNLKKSFFTYRDFYFWSRLIKYSVNKLFDLLNNLLRLEFTGEKFVCLPRILEKTVNLQNKINISEFIELINDIKLNHYPDSVKSMPFFNKIQNYSYAYNKIIDFGNNFKSFIKEIIYLYNNYFSDGESNNFSNLIKTLLVYVLDDYFIVNPKNKSLIIANFQDNKPIHYYQIVKKIINNLYLIKKKILNLEDLDDLKESKRLKISYEILLYIKNKLIFFDFLRSDINEIKYLIA